MKTLETIFIVLTIVTIMFLMWFSIYEQGRHSVIKEGVAHGDIYYTATTNGHVRYNWK